MCFQKKTFKTNVTLNFLRVSQRGLWLSKLVQPFISPFVGRLEDIGTDAYQLISDLREIIDFMALIRKLLQQVFVIQFMLRTLRNEVLILLPFQILFLIK